MNETPAITAMIADDVLEQRELLRITLRQMGCQVVESASDGETAIEKASALKPDILFLDINMPRRYGLEVLDAIRGLGIYTVMVTAHSTGENVNAALNKGARAFVVKPYSTLKIKQAIEHYRLAGSGGG